MNFLFQGIINYSMNFYVLINTFVSILLLFFNDLQVSKSNLGTYEKDFPEFEPFEDQATPRTVPVGGEICFLHLIWVQISHILWLVINDLAYSPFIPPPQRLCRCTASTCVSWITNQSTTPPTTTRKTWWSVAACSSSFEWPS